MKKGKKIWSILLAVLLFVSALPAQFVLAADVQTEVTETVTEDTEDAQVLLNYLVVDKPYLKLGETQSVVVSVGENGTAIDTAWLQYHRESDESTYESEASSVDGDALLFEISFESENQVGSYVLDAVTYMIGGVSETIVLSDTGISAAFGVETEVETNADAEVVDGDEETDYDLDVSIVTFDEEGNQISESSIEDAIAAQESQIAEQALSTYASSSGNVVVVLDPGHDSTHAGATANGLKEEQLTLKIAQYCKAELEAYNGVMVYMTRESNTCPSGASSSTACNKWRVQYAASVGADVYVSIHLNSATTSSVKGAEVYYPNANYNASVGAEGKALASAVLEQLVALGLYNRGIKLNDDDGYTYPDGSTADDYTVINNSKLNGIPAIIVEHAFLTNSSDVSTYLSTEAGLKSLGVADATGIAGYFGLSKRTTKATTVYNGVDYSAVYDYDYYVNKYSDIKAAYGNDYAAVLQHFVTYGMKEGRQAISTFNVKSYRYAYQDLRLAYGTDLKSYYVHYINYGKKEGRTATGTTTLKNPVTSYGGVNYSSVYNYEYYINKYSDIKKAYGDDDVAVLQHFISCGMKEGRRAISTFNVKSYRYAYQDLRLAYRTDLKSYYIHYIYYGKKEGRTATGTTSLKNPVTSYGGVDYSAVYDYEYYINKYSDIKSAYGDDDVAVLQHFVTYGMKEGRRASSAFNVSVYRSNYEDLQKAYGSDLKSYYIHYISYGKKENRNAVTKLYTAIMSSPTTTVSQMVAYFQAKSSYPSYYSSSDATTITAFCQMYYDECVAEGVDPAVAFCQAMKETGFLKFGGSVSISAYNFCGLGAADSNTSGYATFSSVRLGIRAHVQHLKAYASTASLNNTCVDPRFSLVKRGSAVYVEWLGQNENPNGYGWATEVNYGYSIKNNYMAVLYAY